MDGYVASSRITSVRPHRVGAAPDDARWIAQPDTRATGWLAVVDVTTEADPPPVRERVAERWSSISAGWSQTVFYLFDPESWR